jgi:hypothetical protein
MIYAKKPHTYEGRTMTWTTSAPTYRKHVGYFCVKCQTEKRLNMTSLCDCLIFVEDSKMIKAHINNQWVPIYADMEVRL